MAKWSGKIGFGITSESIEEPGLWITTVTERAYCGDRIRSTIPFQTNSAVNIDINLSNQISIIADPFASENFPNILYVTISGNKWKVTSADAQYPRLILTIGGVYNENQSSTS